MRKMTIALASLLMLGAAACSDQAPATTSVANAGDPVHGFDLYRATCIVCHGDGGIGIPGLGKPWVGSDFIDSKTDAEMVAFLLVGRPATDALNTTGVDMLPKGGDNALTEQDLLDLVAYMRTLNL